MKKPAAAYFARKDRVSVRATVGRVCGEPIAPYPPGYAVVVSGERITPGIAEYLTSIRAAGGVLHGASDETFHSVMVVAR